MSTAPTESGRVGEYKVEVYLYDLSQGMAKALSQGFLGKQIDGIWHTGLVVYGYEYFFGGGIQASRPGGSMAGRPGQIIDMGYTRIDPATFHEFLRGVSHRFTAATYSLLDWNCNKYEHRFAVARFTNEAALFLLGKPIPSFITGLPAEALATPFGQMLRPMIAQMEGQMRSGGGAAPGMIPWGGSDLQLPNASMIRPDRMVDAASNPAVPHNVVESAAAIAAQAINQTTPSNVASATPVSPSSSSSSGGVTSLLGRSTPAKLLTSSDKKSKSFQILLKSSAKKHVPTGLTPEQESTLAELVTALAEEGQQVKPAGVELIEGFVRTWSAALQFPVLGLLRLIVLRPECAAHYTEKGEDLAKLLVGFLPAEAGKSLPSNVAPPNAQAMALCTLANLLTHPQLTRLAGSSTIWSAIRSTSTSDNLTVRLMSATLAFNSACLLPKTEDDVVVEAVTFLSEQIKTESAVECETRLLLALGELILSNSSLASLLVGLEFADALTVVKKKFNDAQVQHTTTEILQILKAASDTAFGVQ